MIQGSFDFGASADAGVTSRSADGNRSMPWIEAAKGSPYFVTDGGDSWTPIGQNDAITWPELAGAFRRKNMPAVEAYFAMLRSHGVNCLRLMLEYCQGENRY